MGARPTGRHAPRLVAAGRGIAPVVAFNIVLRIGTNFTVWIAQIKYWTQLREAKFPWLAYSKEHDSVCCRCVYLVTSAHIDIKVIWSSRGDSCRHRGRLVGLPVSVPTGSGRRRATSGIPGSCACAWAAGSGGAPWQVRWVCRTPRARGATGLALRLRSGAAAGSREMGRDAT